MKTFVCVNCGVEVRRPTPPLSCQSCGQQRIGLFREKPAGGAPSAPGPARPAPAGGAPPPPGPVGPAPAAPAIRSAPPLPGTPAAPGPAAPAWTPAAPMAQTGPGQPVAPSSVRAAPPPPASPTRPQPVPTPPAFVGPAHIENVVPSDVAQLPPLAQEPDTGRNRADPGGHAAASARRTPANRSDRDRAVPRRTDGSGRSGLARAGVRRRRGRGHCGLGGGSGLG